MKQGITVFGYGSHAKQIAKKLKQSNPIFIVETDARLLRQALDDGYGDAKLIEATNDEAIKNLQINRIGDFTIVAIDDEAINLFLVLSLRAIYPDMQIIAISNSLEMNHKLSIAGASKVIDIYEPSANKIFNLLEKPYVMKVFDTLFNPKSAISFKEFTLLGNSDMLGKTLSQIDFGAYNIILIGATSAVGEHFTFSTHGHNHVLEQNDVLVCVGKNEDLRRFELDFTT
jgi:voltage-gated potassium channel